MNKIKKTVKLNRRKFLQITAIAGAAGLGWYAGIRPGQAMQVVRRSLPMMGTVLNFIIYGHDQDIIATALDDTTKRMLALEGLLSRFRSDSEVGELNNQGFIKNPSLDLQQVLKISKFVNIQSHGAFDITVLPLVKLNKKYQNGDTPDKASLTAALALVGHQNLHITNKEINFKKSGMEITLDGVGKGYIVDQGVAELQKHGFNNVYVEAGGDLMVRGTKPDNQKWRIGIENPRPVHPTKLVVLETQNKAVATSGDYMQAYNADFSRNHIVNPTSGFSPPELASATITAPTVVLADALATAAMVLGSKKTIKMLANMPDCEGYFIGKDLSHHQTPNFFG